MIAIVYRYLRVRSLCPSKSETGLQSQKNTSLLANPCQFFAKDTSSLTVGFFAGKREGDTAARPGFFTRPRQQTMLIRL